MWFGVMVTEVLQTYDSGNEKLAGWMEPHAMVIVATMIVLLMTVMSLWLWVFLLRRNMRHRSRVVAKQHQLLQQREQQHRPKRACKRCSGRLSIPSVLSRSVFWLAESPTISIIF